MSSISMAPLTPVVKRIMILNFVIWLGVQFIMDKLMGMGLSRYFVLTPELVLEKFWIWQIFSYQFFHALSPSHIVFNMLMLWFVGAELETLWGKKFFTLYYLLSGAGAALIYCAGVGIYAAVSGFRPILMMPVLGASGSLFGLLLAYGIIYSERVIYFMGFFPLKAKYFVLLAGAIDLLSLASAGMGGGDVAYLAHLGGLASGFMILRGHVYYKNLQVKSKLKRKSSNLRLVVDNEKKPDDNKPKYWN